MQRCEGRPWWQWRTAAVLAAASNGSCQCSSSSSCQCSPRPPPIRGQPHGRASGDLPIKVTKKIIYLEHGRALKNLPNKKELPVSIDAPFCSGKHRGIWQWPWVAEQLPGCSSTANHPIIVPLTWGLWWSEKGKASGLLVRILKEIEGHDAAMDVEPRPGMWNVNSSKRFPTHLKS